MSVNSLLNSNNITNAQYLQLYCNSISTNSENLNGGGLVNVGSINGQPIPSIGVDLNPISLIWRPGGVIVPGANVVVSWQSVISKANQININQILNVYLDSSIQNCIVNQSLDCQGRVTFMPFNSNASSPDTLYVQDPNTLTNPKFNGILLVQLQSITQPSIILNGAKLSIEGNGSMLFASSDSTIPGISVQGTGAVLGFEGGSNVTNTNTSNPVINVGPSAVLIMSMAQQFGGSTLDNNLISSTDNTATLNFLYDSSVIGVPAWTNPAFTGTFNKIMSDKAEAVAYNDSLVSPPLGVTQVQAAIDAIKSGGVTFPLQAPDGSASAPSYSFSSASGSGMWNDSFDVNISQGGQNIAQFNGSGMNFVNGFGLYNVNAIQAVNTPSPQSIIFLDGGANTVMTIPPNSNLVEINNNLQVDNQILASAGSSSNPGISFQNGVGTSGMYLAPNQLGISNSGNPVIVLDSAANQVILQPSNALNTNGNNILTHGGSLQLGGGNVTQIDSITANSATTLLIKDGGGVNNISIPQGLNRTNVFGSLYIGQSGSPCQLQLPDNSTYTQFISGTNSFQISNDGSGNTQLVSITPNMNLNSNAAGNLNLQNQGITCLSASSNGSAPYLGFYGISAEAQPTTSVAPATYASVGGTPVLSNDTFNGYSIGQIVGALQSLGLLA